MSRADDAETEGFKGLGTVEEPVDAGEREGARSGYRVFAASDGFELAIAEHIVERALRWGRAAAPNEWYGLIVGRLGADGRGGHVVALGIVPDRDARATPGFVETSHASEFATRALCRRLYPDGVIVGWVHGHHRCGARYSETDRRNQATWTQPHSIGIVVDPWDPRELAVYRGPASQELTLVSALGTRLSKAVSDDAGFRAVAPAVDGTSRSTRGSGPRSPNGAPSLRSAFVLASVMVVLAVISVWPRDPGRRSLDELTRRIQALEARPLAVRCPEYRSAPDPGAAPTSHAPPPSVPQSGHLTHVDPSLRSPSRRPTSRRR